MIEFDAVIFDMDGLLVDSEPVWAICERDMLDRRGKTWLFDVQQKLVGRRMDDFLAGMITAYTLTDTPDALRGELLDQICRIIPEKADARPGAHELIDYLAQEGVPCAIASSSAAVVIEAVVESQQWTEVFKTRITAELVQRGKPAPDVYLEAARRLGVDPSRCLALEDSPTGARAAVAAGMTCFAIPDPSHTAPESFKDITPYLFDSLHDVITRLKQPTQVSR
jgi:HAD superfamily hydrolase (TIGR01509 family)